MSIVASSEPSGCHFWLYWAKAFILSMANNGGKSALQFLSRPYFLASGSAKAAILQLVSRITQRNYLETWSDIGFPSCWFGRIFCESHLWRTGTKDTPLHQAAYGLHLNRSKHLKPVTALTFGLWFLFSRHTCHSFSLFSDASTLARSSSASFAPFS